MGNKNKNRNSLGFANRFKIIMIQDWRDIGATRKGFPASEGDANARVAILESCDCL
jgi:hypothetical protein